MRAGVSQILVGVLRGNSSRVEREVASLEIRVRFPVAAPAECLRGLHGQRAKGRSGFETRAVAQAPVGLRALLVGPDDAAHVVGTTRREVDPRRRLNLCRRSSVERAVVSAALVAALAVLPEGDASLVRRTLRVRLPRAAPRRMPTRTTPDR